MSTMLRTRMTITPDHRVQVDLPDDFPVGEEVEIVVTKVLHREPEQQDIEVAISALEEIAARGNLKKGPDPVQWQREMRKDRPLPGRDS